MAHNNENLLSKEEWKSGACGGIGFGGRTTTSSEACGVKEAHAFLKMFLKVQPRRDADDCEDANVTEAYIPQEKLTQLHLIKSQLQEDIQEEEAVSR